MKKIALVGCTGSIGRQVISVVRRHHNRFALCALIANSSASLFCEQLNRIQPPYAALVDTGAASTLTEIPANTRLFSGEEGALRALRESGADVVVVACGGFAGLKYSLEAQRLGAELALANKETLVCGGDLIMGGKSKPVPIDSEHSAIWQCLDYGSRTDFERLVITASGGAFRGREWSTLSSVTPAEALCHPTWKMGAKITVDSATLLNKGYEVIEAHHLYACPYEKITAVIHPQSIVHSMVQFKDGATLAQLSYPTMELPIQLALSYPERLDCGLRQLDFTAALNLTFEPLKRSAYPLYDLALECGKEGGVLPTALNAASEVAVHAFLSGALGYTDIYTVARRTVEETPQAAADGYARLCEVDEISRRRAQKLIKEVQ